MPKSRRTRFRRRDWRYCKVVSTKVVAWMFHWLPTLSAIFLTAIALTCASSPPAKATGRRWWMTSLLVIGSLAIAGTVWQERKRVGETAALAGTTTSPQASYREPSEANVSELTRQVKTLRDQVRLLEDRKQVRVIRPKVAEDLTEYFKQFGSHRVIVSCIPDNIEAYQYANQLVNVLRAANWDTHGPEVTKIFGDVRGPGINVYINPDDHSDTVKTLFDGFAKFNIPYQGRVTPTQAIPDTETVELFIGTEQTGPVTADGN